MSSISSSTTYTSKFFNAEYFALERANARVMYTTIWEACRILGLDVNKVRVSDAFHQLRVKYYEEELARA